MTTENRTRSSSYRNPRRHGGVHIRRNPSLVGSGILRLTVFGWFEWQLLPWGDSKGATACESDGQVTSCSQALTQEALICVASSRHVPHVLFSKAMTSHILKTKAQDSETDVKGSNRQYGIIPERTNCTNRKISFHVQVYLLFVIIHRTGDWHKTSNCSVVLVEPTGVPRPPADWERGIWQDNYILPGVQAWRSSELAETEDKWLIFVRLGRRRCLCVSDKLTSVASSTNVCDFSLSVSFRLHERERVNPGQCVGN